jgi:hypothetical protein
MTLSQIKTAENPYVIPLAFPHHRNALVETLANYLFSGTSPFPSS